MVIKTPPLLKMREGFFVSGSSHFKRAKRRKKMKRLEFIFKTHISNTDRESGGSYINQDNLFIIIDGVGGEYLGEIAREQAHHIIPETFSRHLSENKSPGDALVYALEEANQGVLEE